MKGKVVDFLYSSQEQIGIWYNVIAWRVMLLSRLGVTYLKSLRDDLRALGV
jgi:hypothetical protein